MPTADSNDSTQAIPRRDNEESRDVQSSTGSSRPTQLALRGDSSSPESAAPGTNGNSPGFTHPAANEDGSGLAMACEESENPDCTRSGTGSTKPSLARPWGDKNGARLVMLRTGAARSAQDTPRGEREESRLDAPSARGKEPKQVMPRTKMEKPAHTVHCASKSGPVLAASSTGSGNSG